MKAIMDVIKFKNIVNNTKRFTGNRSYMMQYIKLDLNADKKYVKATATDGYRISTEYDKIEYADNSFTCYIKPNIPKISKEIYQIELELTDNRLLIQAGDQITGYIQPDGDFYDIDGVINDAIKNDPSAMIGVNAKYLLDGLRSVKDIYRTQDIVKIDVYKENEPLVIRTGGKSNLPENIKLILPVKIRK